jgi:uncharacterized protein (UPF0276 family)
MGQQPAYSNRSLAHASVGVGFKPEHTAEVLDRGHAIDWFEVHAENYMGAGGPPLRVLEKLRARFPLSLHGVGLSIGSAKPLDYRHVARLRRLIDRFQPALFSEHLAWSTHDGIFLNDLLPLPYNTETLIRVCEHVDDVQETLRMRMLLENPSTYVAFEQSTMSEVDFLHAVVKRTGCGMLLDINNVYVCALNHGFDPLAYIDAFPLDHVGEIHLAGFAEDRECDGAPLLIDAHDRPVADIVWTIYRHALARTGPIPTLIEWDNDVPAFSVLAGEATRARAVMNTQCREPMRRVA